MCFLPRLLTSFDNFIRLLTEEPAVKEGKLLVNLHIVTKGDILYTGISTQSYKNNILHEYLFFNVRIIFHSTSYLETSNFTGSGAQTINLR